MHAKKKRDLLECLWSWTILLYTWWSKCELIQTSSVTVYDEYIYIGPMAMPAPKRMHWEEKYLINTYEIFVVISMTT